MQTLAQSRVINPILTTHAQGYIRPGNVGKFLFPTANVAQYGGQVLEFGKESFRRYNTKRAPGSATKRIEFGYAGRPYAIVPSALEALVPDEGRADAMAVPGLDLAQDAVDIVLDTIELEHEFECADIARSTGSYDADHRVALTTTARWRGSAADPMGDVETGVQAIRGSIGVKPNVAILSPSCMSAVKLHEDIIERIKYVGGTSITTELLARLWGIQTVIEGEAVGASGAADDLGDIWGDDVILAYVAPASGGNRRNAARPSYGYTYTITGMPRVMNPYRDENRHSWIYGVSADRTPVLSGMAAGYLIQNAGASPA